MNVNESDIFCNQVLETDMHATGNSAVHFENKANSTEFYYCISLLLYYIIIYLNFNVMAL